MKLSNESYFSLNFIARKRANKEGELPITLRITMNGQRAEIYVNRTVRPDVKLLVATPCKIPVLKQAVLFSCMTGLRISDILQLSWEHIQMGQDGGYLIRMCTEKTEEETNLPISDETLALCGERSEGLIFKGLKRHMVNHPLKEWIKSAGITRRITFHSMRHSFATLLAANGVDILTISKMLTHKSVKNTQIYAKVVDERAREASMVISLK
nr:site-specific integrase [Duncaniella muricolitica]